MNKIVETNCGKVRGHIRDGRLEFLGIPYAEAPVGPRRFRRCVPKRPWDGVFDAAAYGEPPVQMDGGMKKGSEDCLFVNIKRPATDEVLPVFVYIYGGGFNTGSTSDGLYVGDSFAEDGLVFVSFQYRLNVFGFYDFTTFPGCEDFDSNCGLSDQIEAMKWIQNNIAAFGGDPARITICGESAGGSSVLNLMAAPDARGTFRQVIAESALPNCCMTHETARENIMIFLDGMGWTEKDIRKLKDIAPYEVLAANEKVQKRGQYRNPGMFLPGPVQDDLLPERPMDAIRSGSAKDIRLIIGTTKDEGTMFVHDEDTAFPNSWEMIENMFERNGHKDAFPAFKDYYASLENPFVRFATDYAFQVPALHLAAAQSMFNKNVWVFRYEFSSKSGMESGMRATHASELPAVFAVAKDHPWADFIFAGEEEEAVTSIIHDVHGNWVSFAKTGEPETKDWSPYAGDGSMGMIFDRTSRAEAFEQRDLLKLWGELRFYDK